MVVADHGRTTVACCIRRDALQRCRTMAAVRSAGDATEVYLRRTCPGVAAALEDAQRDGGWLSVGPILPGIRIGDPGIALRVGNAAGEAHPLVGEGIGMAMRSASLLLQSPGAAATGKPRCWFLRSLAARICGGLAAGIRCRGCAWLPHTHGLP